MILFGKKSETVRLHVQIATKHREQDINYYIHNTILYIWYTQKFYNNICVILYPYGLE